MQFAYSATDGRKTLTLEPLNGHIIASEGCAQSLVSLGDGPRKAEGDGDDGAGCPFDHDGPTGDTYRIFEIQPLISGIWSLPLPYLVDQPIYFGKVIGQCPPHFVAWIGGLVGWLGGQPLIELSEILCVIDGRVLPSVLLAQSVNVRGQLAHLDANGVDKGVSMCLKARSHHPRLGT